MEFSPNSTLAYVVGVALGDGNLSRPNGRATRLRITCDARYPDITAEIIQKLQEIFPKNKVSIAKRNVPTHYDISVYSNNLDILMPWKVNHGSKNSQGVRVPMWIRGEREFVKACLKGLIQTDGCIYTDRGYKMINFSSANRGLAEDVRDMLSYLNFKASFHATKLSGENQFKFNVRIAKNSKELISELDLYKSLIHCANIFSFLILVSLK